jgi:glycogen debranching enzyme
LLIRKKSTYICLILACFSALFTGHGTAAEVLIPQRTEVAPLQADIGTHPNLVLKNGGRFLVMNEQGMVHANEGYGHGLYFEDSRYLSNWDIHIDGTELALLSSSVSDSYAGQFLYGNRQLIYPVERSAAARDAKSKKTKIEPFTRFVLAQKLLVERDIIITDALREKIKVTNCSDKKITIDLSINYDCDYADIFEIRGFKRKVRGTIFPVETDLVHRTVVLSYKGLDDQWMDTSISFRGAPIEKLDRDQATFVMTLAPRASQLIECTIVTGRNKGAMPIPQTVTPSSYEKERQLASQEFNNWRQGSATISSDNSEFNRLIERSERDIFMLRQPTPKGMCIAAGVPWFAAAFGRDQAVTAGELLPFMPGLAREVLLNLAAYQGKKANNYTEEVPGKIMHELRVGEMARCHEIAFTPYYGSVDSTPLWLNLYCDYWHTTGDSALIHKLAGNAKNALDFLNTSSVGGYLIYGNKNGATLFNQGWKDSQDSITYRDGTIARPPVAVCEAQGYLYSAWKNVAAEDNLFPYSARVKAAAAAQKLKSRFNKDFWMNDRNYVALALAKYNKPCGVIASNAGQLLGRGILSHTQEDLVAKRLMQNDMFCGWGIRTLSSEEAAYNPMSYQNGSVWPHDNALIIEGLHSVHKDAFCQKAVNGLFSAALAQRDLRLPELFCGFSSSQFDRPVWYPTSCSPQAWSAGSVFGILQGMLGIHCDALHNQLILDHPVLPSFINTLDINNLSVGKAKISLRLSRVSGHISCKVTARSGNVKFVQRG